MKAKEIASAIERFAPISLQEDWDNSGFCIGSPESDVNKVLVGFDCTPSIVEEAISIGADMIITHHPLIFTGIKKISDRTMTGRMIISAIKNDIVIYSCHTNMDKVPGGVSGRMAAKLGLRDVKILQDDGTGNGLGVIGLLPCPLHSEDFVKLVKDSFSLQSLRSSKLIDKPISKVAMCGGSGREFIGKAEFEGADAYLCGDISYHNFFCDSDFMVLDVGHYESEIDIVQTIYDIVRENFPTFAAQIAKSKNNPVFYY